MRVDASKFFCDDIEWKSRDILGPDPYHNNNDNDYDDDDDFQKESSGFKVSIQCTLKNFLLIHPFIRSSLLSYIYIVVGCCIVIFIYNIITILYTSCINNKFIILISHIGISSSNSIKEAIFELHKILLSLVSFIWRMNYCGCLSTLLCVSATVRGINHKISLN